MSINNNAPIDILNLSNRSYNCLRRNGVATLSELLQLSMEEIRNFRYLGEKSAQEIEDVLHRLAMEGTEEFQAPNSVTSEFEDDSQSGEPSRVDVLPRVTVLHYIDELSVINEVEYFAFFDANGILVEDLPLNEVNLSLRAQNALGQKEIFSLKQILDMKYQDFINIRNMGAATQTEILQIIKDTLYIQYSLECSEEVEAYAEIICKDIQNWCPKLERFLYENPVKAAVFHNKALFLHAPEPVLESSELMAKVYKENALRKIFENYICKVLMDRSVLSMFALKQRLPEGLRTSGILMELVGSLAAAGKIEYGEEGLKYCISTVWDHAQRLEEGNKKQALLLRLQGKTLEETGTELGVTRERARQLSKKAVEKLPKLWEENFRYWYETYDITKEEFVNIFCIPDTSYNYLKNTYKSGTEVLGSLLDDPKLSGPAAQRAVKEMYKYCVVIDGEYVPIKREALMRKLLEYHYSTQDCNVSEFYKVYMDYIESIGQQDNEKLLYPSEHAFEARLADQRYVVNKYGRRIRYYNMDEYDLEALFKELDISSYDGLDLSTLKFYRTYPELMKDYNIQDEYELHNIMKKNEEMLYPYKIQMGRMPFLSVGDADREQQTLALLYKVAPIGAYEFADIFEEEYGVRSETVMANFARYIDRYYSNGVFSIDYVAMTKEEYDTLGRILAQDLYFIEDIEAIYLEYFPNGNVEKINPYNLKTMGFLVFVNYVIRNTYRTSDEYFRTLLLSKDVTDLALLDRRIIYNQAFQMVIEDLRTQFSILEFEKNKYVTFERFAKGAPDVTKDDLLRFTNEAVQYCDDEFFTIRSIRSKGFTSKLDDLGFEDWFYAALLRANKKVRYIKTGGSFIFGRTGKQFKTNELFHYLMKRFKKISIGRFMDYLKEEYGLVFDKHDVTTWIYHSSMYYDPIMEKVYLNKEEYYEDI